MVQPDTGDLTPGTLSLSGTWPAGLPTWFNAWLQVWTVDLVGPSGHGASNALVASQLWQPTVSFGTLRPITRSARRNRGTPSLVRR